MMMFVVKYMIQLILLDRLINCDQNSPIGSELKDADVRELPFSLGVCASCKGFIVT
jgi:hypothetical protein